VRTKLLLYSKIITKTADFVNRFCYNFVNSAKKTNGEKGKMFDFGKNAHVKN
jgi:hypothetical protein